MKVDISKLEEKDLILPDDYLISLVHKDIVRGTYCYYGKLDKKWLECKTFFGEDGKLNVQALMDFYIGGAKVIISRYACLTFASEIVDKLQIEDPSLRVITERSDDEGEWLVCQITWQYFIMAEDGKKQPMINLAGLKFCKTDYVPPVMYTDELLKAHPEIAQLKANEFTTISAKEALKLAIENSTQKEKQ